MDTAAPPAPSCITRGLQRLPSRPGAPGPELLLIAERGWTRWEPAAEPGVETEGGSRIVLPRRALIKAAGPGSQLHSEPSPVPRAGRSAGGAGAAAAAAAAAAAD
ncbi:hypothetical protein J1605_021638 [Eschrichtius robustus]|uniref:Uncharacterized protein n=1 Tax=Eschrichtius robustus TaxID=9764 RepID=A0AB34HG00_ESCRO|nr:hypothetical protein J1605_021638 [Eschrichtius robustus]